MARTFCDPNIKAAITGTVLVLSEATQVKKAVLIGSHNANDISCMLCERPCARKIVTGKGINAELKIYTILAVNNSCIFRDLDTHMAERKTLIVKINRRTTKGLSSGVLLEEKAIGEPDLLILTRTITGYTTSSVSST